MSCLRVSPLFFPCMTSGFLFGCADSFEIHSNPISPASAVHNLRLKPPFFSYRKSLITCMLLSSAQTWMGPKTSFSFSGRSSYHTGHLLAPQAHWYWQVVITVYSGVHFSLDVLPSWADRGSCGHKFFKRNAVNKSVWRKKRLFLTSLKQTCNEYLIKFSGNQSAPKLENRKTSPCSPCAPNFNTTCSYPGY